MDNEFLDISTSLRLQIGYGIGHILNDVCASLWFTYFLVFFHLVLNFSSSQAGNLLLIGQVVDAVSTPFVGYHSDHTDGALSAKYGRGKIWHLFGTACVVASFPFIFSECIGCSTTHKWAQMFYFASFITIFQIGWAAVQISHLSLIPELSDSDHTRTHLTAIRFGCTVFSNLFVYIVTWIVLHLSGECDKHQLGPDDAWKFRIVVYIVMFVGLCTSIMFHVVVQERRPRRQDNSVSISAAGMQTQFLKRPALYQVAGIYMCTRIVVNVSQVLVPLYLHKSLRLAARSLAIVPLAMYLGSLAAAAFQRVAPKAMPRKLHYLFGSLCAIGAYIWIYLDSDYNYKEYYIYVVAVMIGFGGAVILVTSLALTADLVGSNTDASAFVYGLMSFTDKLSCGVVIAVIQYYADDSDTDSEDKVYYRYVLSFVCGGATIAGLLLTLLLPKLNNNVPVLLSEDNPRMNEDQASLVPPNL